MESSLPPSRLARFFASIIDHPRIAALAMLFFTLLALGGYFRPSWPQDLWRSFQQDSSTNDGAGLSNEQRRVTASMNVRRDSLGSAQAFLVVESDQFFSLEGAAAIRDIIEQLERQETIANVQWLDQAPPLNIFGLSEPILPRGQASPQRFEIAKAKALKHPLVVGMFLSKDARTLLIGINFNWIFVDEDADCTTHVIEVAQQTLAKHPGVSMSFAMTGGIPLRIALLENQASNEFTFQLIGYGMIVGMAIILFRGLTVVLVVAVAPALGVFWSLGFLRYFGWEDNPFSQVILPVLLSLVGFADGVHMMVYIRQSLSKGQLPAAACRSALSTVGIACSLTTLTTAIGMGSLAFSGNEVVREFAFSCVLGVCTILVTVLLIIPLACSTRLGKQLARGADRGIVDRYLQHVGKPVMAVVRYSRYVSYFAILLLIVLATMTLQLRPDDRQSNALPSGSEAQRALERIDRTMGGLDVAYVRIKWSDDEVDQHEIASVINEADQLIDREPLLAHPLSLCRLLAALPGEETVVNKMPMAELLPPPLKLALYDPDNRTATITFRVQDLGTAKYKPSFERVEAGLERLEQQHEGFKFEMDGSPVRRWKNLFQIVSDLARSLGTASIQILIVMAIAFRSAKLGLIAIVPNVVPLATAGAFMAVFGWPLDIVSVCSFTICLGIAVDDTIHFLSRYREEQAHQPDQRLALQQAFQGVGTGMIMTTIVLVAGFSSVLISQTRDHRVFGMLGVITLLAALVCDLFLLPSLLAYFDRPTKAKSVN